MRARRETVKRWLFRVPGFRRLNARFAWFVAPFLSQHGLEHPGEVAREPAVLESRDDLRVGRRWRGAGEEPFQLASDPGRHPVDIVGTHESRVPGSGQDVAGVAVRHRSEDRPP